MWLVVPSGWHLGPRGGVGCYSCTGIRGPVRPVAAAAVLGLRACAWWRGPGLPSSVHGAMAQPRPSRRRLPRWASADTGTRGSGLASCRSRASNSRADAGAVDFHQSATATTSPAAGLPRGDLRVRFPQHGPMAMGAGRWHAPMMRGAQAGAELEGGQRQGPPPVLCGLFGFPDKDRHQAPRRGAGPLHFPGPCNIWLCLAPDPKHEINYNVIITTISRFIMTLGGFRTKVHNIMNALLCS